MASALGSARLAAIMLLALTAMLAPASASAAVVFDGSPETAAPPATLGPYAMMPFAPDPALEFEVVPSAPGPTGPVGFMPSAEHLVVPETWASWSHGYAGDVYYTDGANLTLTPPAGTRAFYLYAEPDSFGEVTFTATSQDGTTSGPVSIEGDSGAKYLGFYATEGDTIDTIAVASQEPSFAVGEFGIAANRPPVAGDDAYNAVQGQILTVPAPGVLSNDTDPDGDPLTVSGVTSPPTKGTLTLNSDGSFGYFAEDFGGTTDTFEYQVSDGAGGFDTATVTITIKADCGGLTPTRTGTQGADVIQGTAGVDVIVGNGGADRIMGVSSADVICGGSSDDVIDGGSGNDRLFGGTGNDTVKGFSGNDAVNGQDGDDKLTGDSGNDSLNGGPGNDDLSDSTGTDRCDGGTGVDVNGRGCEAPVVSIP